MTKQDEILLVLGRDYLRQHEDVAQTIDALTKEFPGWTAAQIVQQANRSSVNVKVRDSLMVRDSSGNSTGVVTAVAGVMGRMTADVNGTPGTMSRTRVTEAISTGENGTGIQRLRAVPNQ